LRGSGGLRVFLGVAVRGETLKVGYPYPLKGLSRGLKGLAKGLGPWENP